MSLFTLIKLTRTRHLLDKKQVPAGTPGAVKVTEESRHWYIAPYRPSSRRPFAPLCRRAGPQLGVTLASNTRVTMPLRVLIRRITLFVVFADEGFN